ncbi:Hypothetical predicted protein [Cloeon dipterum]|uniref:Uncharacterized protein n=1 Tax=Cloeon dipterum TaxID=197152 RepID=A0A8S1CZY0_9INSE|nr:Hypothetical predicted protein [Cloeon dipterum]
MFTVTISVSSLARVFIPFEFLTPFIVHHIFTSDRLPVMAESQLRGLVNNGPYSYPNQGAMENWRVTYPSYLRFINIFELIIAICDLGPCHVPHSNGVVFLL